MKAYGLNTNRRISSYSVRPNSSSNFNTNPKPLRKYHTIHLRESRKPFVFHIHESKDSPSRTFLVCFKDIDMAKQMVHLIRIHYAVNGEWPETHIYPEEPLEMILPKDVNLETIDIEKVPKIWIRSWNESELEQFSVSSLLHLFQINDNNTVEMYRFEYDLTTLQKHFEGQLD